MYKTQNIFHTVQIASVDKSSKLNMQKTKTSYIRRTIGISKYEGQ